MSRTKGSRNVGRLLFFIPVAVVIGLVLFGLASIFSNQSGTLIIEAESSGRYTPTIQLHPRVSVGAATQTSPFNLTLSQGEYTVVYGALNWYATPSPRSIFVSNGKAQFAVGTYSPILRVIDIMDTGFTSTQVTALHGVTPVVWINRGSSAIVFVISGAAHVPLSPSQNYTTVFANIGTFDFSVQGTSYNGAVTSV